MRDQETALSDLLIRNGWHVSEKPRRAQLDVLPPDARAELIGVYRALGGLDPLPVRAGPWDMAFEGRIVEYDEEQHFNRYRMVTFESASARHLPWCSAYLDFSARYEDECKRKAAGGGFWTSERTERMFGPAGPRGVLSGPGSPRWKQRAFYDTLRDMTARHAGQRMARLSIWDEVGGVQLGRALRGLAPLDQPALLTLIEERTVG